MNPWLAVRNLLAVRLDNAGDVVMLGPALRAIKSASPECQITLLASPAGAKAMPTGDTSEPLFSQNRAALSSSPSPSVSRRSQTLPS